MPISKRFQKLLLFNKRTELRKILANISWLFADRILRMGCGLVVGVWIARYLGVEQFGIFNYATAFVAMFSPFANLGLDWLVVQRLVADPSKQQKLMGTSFWLRFLAGWLTWGITILGVFLFRHEDPISIAVVAILGFSSIFQCIDTIDLWFQSQLQSKYTVVAKNTAFIIATLLRVGLITLRAPLVSFAWISLLEIGLGAVGLIIIYEQQGHLLRSWSWSLSLAKELIRDSLPLIFSGFAIMIYMRIDQIMLGQMVGDKAVGIYSAAARVSEVWYFIPMAIATSVAPSIYEAKKISEELYYQRIGQLNRLLVIGAIVVALPMTYLSGTIIHLLFGNSYAEAGNVLSILIWGSIFVFTGLATSSWFTAEGLNHIVMYRTFLGAITNIVLNIFLIPRYGGVGAATATVISYALADLFFHAIHPKTAKLFKIQIKLF